MWAQKEQRSHGRIVSGARSLKSPGCQGRGIGEGWGIFFCKAASKGLPRPFNAAGWRCPQLKGWLESKTSLFKNLELKYITHIKLVHELYGWYVFMVQCEELRIDHLTLCRTCVSEHNPQQFHGYNWMESLV